MRRVLRKTDFFLHKNTTMRLYLISGSGTRVDSICKLKSLRYWWKDLQNDSNWTAYVSASRNIGWGYIWHHWTIVSNRYTILWSLKISNINKCTLKKSGKGWNECIMYEDDWVILGRIHICFKTTRHTSKSTIVFLMNCLFWPLVANLNQILNICPN